MMRDQNQPCVLALEKRLVENGKNCEKFYENERYSEISEKPEMKKPEFVEKIIFVLVELFVYLFTYRFHISFVISTVCVIFQGYGQELNKVGCV